MEKYYKVVDRDLQSSKVSGTYAVQYELNKFVKSKIGKVFCYDDLRAAIKNADFLEGQNIYLCEVKNPTKVMIILDFSHIVNISEEIEKFWKLGRTKVNSYCLMKTPAHTVLADEIKLVRQITDEEILEVQDDTL